MPALFSNKRPFGKRTNKNARKQCHQENNVHAAGRSFRQQHLGFPGWSANLFSARESEAICSSDALPPRSLRWTRRKVLRADMGYRLAQRKVCRVWQIGRASCRERV